ncbi:hypothetical protein ThrDRAFT_02723 [Frankia casuarinae]|uniref:GmrSD restriction endonucleases N-terminal domain-containing protein n=2 Tax=Frankia casuarinae (strain DSM 45818 / CECT 9043 / HFP020203 / CcI3) TaxID=106370 RepID=Q2JAZ2_FRACC|nr:protein of unknown function DUF262 [Frankia casuarinae]EYT91600.1 hypothetical protein ThrDRAFT_02723 [Frankia casuarinae]KDA41176.1 hypothetical protein BMG523Draft_04008 [Frankia sp. BMG5.23]OHV52902.1 hypothetical protein CgIS1_15940 [Frankia sp. CgIS1]
MVVSCATAWPRGLVDSAKAPATRAGRSHLAACPEFLLTRHHVARLSEGVTELAEQAGNDSDSEDLRDDDRAELQEVDPDPPQISYSGTDFDVEGLVRRHDRGDIIVPSFGNDDPGIETAGFQREFVWKRSQMDRFIESLLLGYPIPGIFLVQQQDRRYLVLDGQQRIKTLSLFYNGSINGREFALQNVAARFQGLTYQTFSPEQRRTLDNTFIQATIVKTDGTRESLDGVYQIFERLNSGGTQLTPHEIRVALYAGEFIKFLTALNENPAWRALYGPPSPRLRDQEIVLRFIALYVSPGSYKRPLKKYLNDFVGAHRRLNELDAELIEKRFDRAAQLVLEEAGRSAIRGRGRQLNAALTEALLVGLARRLDAGSEPTAAEVSRAIDALLNEPDLDYVTTRATADEESVRMRLALATRAFSRI